MSKRARGEEDVHLNQQPLSFEIGERQSKPVGHGASWGQVLGHTVTAVVGVGILGLPYAFSCLGWIGGLLALTIATVASLYTSCLLASMHEDKDGHRHNRYEELGKAVLGERAGFWAVATTQFILLVGLMVTYMVTAGQSLQAASNPNCNDHTMQAAGDEGSIAAAGEPDAGTVGCRSHLTAWIAVFAVLQLGLSQIPKFENLWWISILGAIMSACYATIAFVASVLHEEPETGVSYSIRPGNLTDQVFGALNALGTIMFAFGGHAILLEIQATLRSPPSTLRPMMFGLFTAYAVIIVAYFPVACAGYARFGNSVNPDVLLSVQRPAWLIKAANLMVCIHIGAAYQVFAQPVFKILEDWVKQRFGRAADKLVAVRLIIRSSSVIITAGVAMLLPFFSDLMGLIGAIAFTPITFVLPSLFWLKVKQPVGLERFLQYAIIAFFGTFGSLAAIGATRQLAIHSSEYTWFS
ncbi:hypothetical protein WJX74_003668 [Apatococcus lobatus]|uniref:Amino acid transporter transmembrane domain-containing protein n=1 Tax=Apatococcus lobatus TaxID=904363 RepID=A0AAW1RB96_9CHLO